MIIESVFDAEAMARAAVSCVVLAAEAAIAERGSFSIAFSGGGTPRRAYQLLSSAAIDWSKVEVYWVDERHVPSTDKDSNEYLVRETLLSHIPIPEKRIHPMVTGPTPAESAANYEALLRSAHSTLNTNLLDLAIMGIGPDGHTASLFPGIKELDEKEHWVVPTLSPAGVRDRVTLSVPALSQVGLLLFLVEGEAKQDPLRKILAADTPLLPGAIVGGAAKHALWIVTEDARG